MASLDELLKAQQEATKLLGEIVKHLAKAGGAPGGEPSYAGKKGTVWQKMQQFRAGQNLGVGGMARGMSGGGWGAAGGAGGGLSGLGKAGGAIGIIAQVGVALATLPWKIKDFAEGLHSANRVFAQFSPAMAQVFAMSDWRDTIRNIKMGDDLAGSAGTLAAARGDLLDKLAPVDTAKQKAMNATGQFAADFANKFGETDWMKAFLDRHTRGMKVLGELLGLQQRSVDTKDDWIKEMEFLDYAEELKRQGRALPVNNPLGGNAVGGQRMWEELKKRAEGGF